MFGIEGGRRGWLVEWLVHNHSLKSTPDPHLFPTAMAPLLPPPLPVWVFFYWVVFSFATQSVTILPHRLHCTVTASPDAANAHITYFSSHDSGIRVVSTEITRSVLNNGARSRP